MQKIFNKILANWIQQYIKKDYSPGPSGIYTWDTGLVQYPQNNVIHHINKRKDKNHMILSTDAEKAFDKIQHPFLIKTLKKVGIEVSHLELLKAIYEQPNANIILNGEKLSFPPKVRNKTGMSTLATVIQHSIGSLSLCNQTTQRNQRHPNWPGGGQTFTHHR